MQTFQSHYSGQEPAAVALGFFDGVHRGHRRVLGSAAAQRQNGLLPVCLTFAESPKSVIAGVPSPSLMTRTDKLRAMEDIGIDRVIFADFRAVMHLSAREFFRRVLLDALHAKALYCGFNYRFGKNAEGDTAMLEKLCDESGVSLTVVPPETDNGEVVCSTLIKRLIAEGNIRRANALLGSRFGVTEVIRHGRRLGHSLGAPTINQPLTAGLVVPRFGVYVSEVTLENGARCCGVTNIGIKPTVGGTTPLWETWMPRYAGGEIYGETADVRLLDFIREERRFGSLDALKEEILQNGAKALAIYREFRQAEET